MFLDTFIEYLKLPTSRPNIGGNKVVDVAAVKVNLELSYHEARAVRSAIQNKIKKLEKSISKSSYVPEDGKLHLDKEYIKGLKEVEDRLDKQLTKAIEEHK